MSFQEIVERRTDAGQLSITIAHIEHYVLRWATKYQGHNENRFFGHLFTLDPLNVLKHAGRKGVPLFNISGISLVP